VVLNDTLTDEEIMQMIKTSFELTSSMRSPA
jgi:predicted DNA-binding protein (MmcQ/YjbR family)